MFVDFEFLGLRFGVWILWDYSLYKNFEIENVKKRYLSKFNGVDPVYSVSLKKLSATLQNLKNSFLG